jgi:HNH endonuclease
MSSYVGADLRRLVVARARNRCEYCLIHEDDALFAYEVDHIISVKHGGVTDDSNLAYACMICNRQKGSDLGSIDWHTSQLVRFYNPRQDLWADHFILEGARIKPLTVIGEVTARIFEFNSDERILERHELLSLGRYP